MRNRFILAAMLAVTPFLPATAQQINIGNRAAPDIAVRLTGPFAQLRVIGWKSDSVSITGFMPNNYRLENVFSGDPGVPSRGAKLYIDGPETVTAKAAILELRVPVSARVWIKGGTSQLIVTGITGELDLNMVGGTIHVTGNPRILSAEGIDANITVDGNPEWVRLKTAAGNIVMSGNSTDAAFATVSGSATVGRGTYERARFESVTGSLTFAGDLARSASLSFDSHSGAIELRLDPKAGVSIDAETMGGTIDNGLSAARGSPTRDSRGQEIALELGFGGGRIMIRTFKGNVRFVRRP